MSELTNNVRAHFQCCCNSHIRNNSIGFVKAYGLYDTIDELLQSDTQWSDEKQTMN